MFDLLDCIIQVRENKIYRFFDCSSIFEYCVKILKLDPGVVYGFTAVAKKIKEIPELKEKIIEGSLNVSTAKRITSVLTQANKEEWFTKASTLPLRKLEKEVAKENPKEEIKEKASYLRSERIKLELGLSEELMLRLRRIQDLESQKNKRSTSLEEVLEVMAHEYLNKNDPVKKAQRAKVRGKIQILKSSMGKKMERTIPKNIFHQVMLRDEGRCQYFNLITNTKCKNTRFIEVHHKMPLSQGGTHELTNLITLCSEHHKITHMKMDNN